MITVTTTKDIFNDFIDAQELVDRAADFDFAGVQAICCMLIDTIAAKHEEDPIKIAKNIYDAVKAVNAEYGAYQLA